MEWIKVTDKEPDNAGYYLTYGNMINGKYEYDVSWFLGTKDGFCHKEYHGHILYWQPLPPPPISDNNDCTATEQSPIPESSEGDFA